MVRVSHKRALLCVVGALCALSHAAVQTPKSANHLRDCATQERSIKVQTTLVLVPVFVYPVGALERPMNAEEKRCAKDGLEAFFASSAEQPYFWICPYLAREVKDLTLGDFQLFQDGKSQKIETVGKELWWLNVRDNRTWHVETSDTPTGIWSTTDLDHSLSPAPPRLYYLLGYTPTDSQEGCHQIRVEVRREKVRVFARDEFCAEQTPSDLLNGTKIGKKLESALGQKGNGKIPLFIQAGAIRGGAHQTLVDVVLEFPWNQLNHSWEENTATLKATISILGAVYTKDGRLVTRFSDLLWPSYWPTIVEGDEDLDMMIALGVDPGIAFSELTRREPGWLPNRYETQFALAPGEYDLRVVLSDGSKVGRAEVPLTVENNDAKSLALGSIFLGNRFRDAHVAAVEADAANFAPEYVPLVSKGVRVTPAGETDFIPDGSVFAYFEIYEPKLAVEPPPQIQAHLRIIDTKNRLTVKDYPTVDATPYTQPGSTIIPVAREIPISTLRKGEYRLEVQASDSAGRTTPWRVVNFTITPRN